jgi:hypothetical protein
MKCDKTPLMEDRPLTGLLLNWEYIPQKRQLRDFPLLCLCKLQLRIPPFVIVMLEQLVSTCLIMLYILGWP